MPPYEITKIVRAAGYDPLTRPRREGNTYVVRATNYRGILMRIVVPSALPGIWDSLRISLGWAWTWLVLATGVAVPPVAQPERQRPGAGGERPLERLLANLRERSQMLFDQALRYAA